MSCTVAVPLRGLGKVEDKDSFTIFVCISHYCASLDSSTVLTWWCYQASS